MMSIDLNLFCNLYNNKSLSVTFHHHRKITPLNIGQWKIDTPAKTGISSDIIYSNCILFPKMSYPMNWLYIDDM